MQKFQNTITTEYKMTKKLEKIHSTIYKCNKIQMRQNANATKYKCAKMQIQQNTKVAKYKYNKIQNDTKQME